MLTRVHPGPSESFELDAPATRDRLLELYRPDAPEWLRLNLVVSVSGSAAGSDGTSESLTSRTDRRILGVIRELSDAVLVGAQSVRAEGYQLPKRSKLVVVSTSGDLSGHGLGADGAGSVTVVCPASAVPTVRETLGDAAIIEIDAVDGRIPVENLVAALRGAGFASIVCEGGPALAGQLLEADLVDDVCLTTSPVLTEVRLPALRMPGLTQRPVTLRQLLVDDDSAVFARWAVRD
jgi:riboflavin biosynthesis pyrimidine reductase